VVTVADIGLEGGEPVMRLATAQDVWVPARDRRAHKWSAGAVATIGGVPGLTGAALLCARSAMAAGAGVSTIFTTAATAAAYEALAPDIPTMQASETGSWHGHASEVLALLGRFDVLVVGPGLEPAPQEFIEQLLEAFDGTLIVDAGAVTSISRLDTLLERTAPTILTPHAGEFTRFSGLDPTWESAARIATGTESIVLLKGPPTFVAGADVTAVATGGPELASIGTGDVLAGIIAALVARGVEPERAAWTGAYLHGVAGHTLASRRTVTAVDLIRTVGEVMAGIEGEGRGGASRSDASGHGYR
jgi:NAD(P)H-hydrate epimerase